MIGIPGSFPGFRFVVRGGMQTRSFRILHCLRAPVGGLFRHVRDLAREQTLRGHDVAVLCDSETGDALTEARLAELADQVSLGLHKVPMSREIGLADVSATTATRRLAADLKADVLHGHGAKGGAYARLATTALKRSGRTAACFYTPHGGSLHYDPKSLKGMAFMAAERHLMGQTDGLIFESRYAADTFAAKVGAPTCPARVIHNGVLREELQPVQLVSDPVDFIFVGELRHLKGVDVLLAALACLNKERPVRAVIAGAGPEEGIFREQAKALGLAAAVTFPGAVPARAVFPRGRVLVMPSRAESLPYVALEAAGAGIPLIATRVGGVPEIVAGTGTELVEPGDANGLAVAMRDAMQRPARAVEMALRLQRNIAERFSVEAMTGGVLGFYAEALPANARVAPAGA